jgi:hypothetical protein
MNFGRTMAAVLLAAGAVALLLPWPAQASALVVAGHLAASLLLFAAGSTVARRMAFPSAVVLLSLARLVAALAVLRAALQWSGPEAESFSRLGEAVGVAACLAMMAAVAVITSLVVGSGAVRVAEVAARFALDALPGKQLGLDTAAGAGALSADAVAENLRAAEVEANFFGSMDGATRFLRAESLALLSAGLLGAAAGAALHLDRWAGPVAFASLASAGLMISAAITASNVVMLVTESALGAAPAARPFGIPPGAVAPLLALAGCAVAILGLLASPHLWLITIAGLVLVGGGVAASLSPSLRRRLPAPEAPWRLVVPADLPGPALTALLDALPRLREDLTLRLGFDPGLPSEPLPVDPSLPPGEIELLVRDLRAGRFSSAGVGDSPDEIRWALFARLVAAAHLLLTRERAAALADLASAALGLGTARRLPASALHPLLRRLLEAGLPIPPPDLLADAVASGGRDDQLASLRRAAVHYLMGSSRGHLLARQLHPDGRALLERLRDGEPIGEDLDAMRQTLLAVSQTRPDRRWPMLLVEPQWAEQLARLLSGSTAEVVVVSPSDLPLFLPTPPVEVLQDGLRQG